MRLLNYTLVYSEFRDKVQNRPLRFHNRSFHGLSISSSVNIEPFNTVPPRQLKKRFLLKYYVIIHDKFSNKTIQRTGKEKLTLMGNGNRKFVTKQKHITNENGREE
jgi:hypothetical protein